MLIANGLGAYVSVAIPSGVVSNAAPRPGSVGVAPPKVDDPIWTRAGVDHAKNYITDQWRLRIAAAQASIEAQWGAQLKPSNPLFCRVNAQESGEMMMYPIGVAMVLGVPFTAQELAGHPHLERTGLQPTGDQRFALDFAVYGESQAQLALWFGRKISGGTDRYLDLVDPSRGIQKILDDKKLPKLSVQDALDHGPWVLGLAGYGLNPIPPTSAELNDRAVGLRAYYARGGFLIHSGVASGQVTAATTPIKYATGYIDCGGTPAVAFQAVSGMKFHAKVTVGPTYTLALDEAEPGLASKAAGKFASIAKIIETALCSSQEQVAALNKDTLLAAVCTTTAGTPCKSGTSGCYCTSPTSTQQAAVQAGNVLIGMWCKRLADIATTPPPNAGFVPPPPGDGLFPAAASKVPWWLVVGGGLAAGAVLFSRK